MKSLPLLIAVSLCLLFFASSAQIQSDESKLKEENVLIEFFNSENCNVILSSIFISPYSKDSEEKCESVISQAGEYMNYWVKSVRINGHCSNVQAYDTLQNSCLRFQ